MAWPGPGPGRPKGSKNKVTIEAKKFLTDLCQDPKVQAAVRRRVLKGDTGGFFKAMDKLVPDAPRETKVTGELRMIQWPDMEDIPDE